VLRINLYKGATPDPVYSYTRNCTTSDCGPDSAGRDNYRVRVPIGTGTVLFDRMELSVTNTGTQGAATLEGGSDIGTLPSTFDVVTPATPIQCTNPVSSVGGGTTATVTFLTGPDGCPVDKGYVLNVATKKIELITGGDTTHIQTLVQSDWAAEPAPPAPVKVSPCTPSATCVLNAATNTYEETEVYCNGTYDPTDAWDPDPLSPTYNPDGTYGASMPPGHFWCRITESVKIAGPDSGPAQVQESQLSLLIADATRGK
jgi:hypothetical protein